MFKGIDIELQYAEGLLKGLIEYNEVHPRVLIKALINITDHKLLESCGTDLDQASIEKLDEGLRIALSALEED